MKVCKCDGCGKIYREEEKFCDPEEVTFKLSRYHMGNGMYLPTGKLEASFCKLSCFKKWFDEKMINDFKEVSKI